MVQSNKILTVSYGTFSCTLEGFEDSFETMKAIAEYFRDLAADDRYFGAEPPQPDAEMLARIAQREIARQVEARREAGGIVLRASAAPATALTAQARPAPVMDAVADAVMDAVAAPGIAGTAAAAVAVATVPEPTRDSAAGAGVDDAAARPQSQAVAEPAGPAGPEDAAEPLWAEPEPDYLPAADSIAAKLQRIRAVVSRNEQAAREDYSEDQHAEPVNAEAADDLIEALHHDERDVAGSEDQDNDKIAAVLGRFDTGHAGDIAAAVTQTAAADDHGASAGDADRSADADIGADGADLLDDEDEDFADDADILDADEDDEDTDEDDDDLAAISGRTLFGAFGEADDDDLDDADISNILGRGGDDTGRGTGTRAARLVKIRRADFEAAVASGQLQAVDEDATTAGSLSPEDEADLLRELAEVEAELVATRPEDAAPAPLAAPVDENAPDLSRLMQEVGAKLSDPEAAARHETYSRMRAAVATTKAERSAGGTMGSHPSDDPYRDDLASVVRPRRPEAAQTRPVRPATEPRPAPLRLVAELRVDEGAASATRGPVRPRRVSTRLLDEPEAAGTPATDDGFVEFAAEMGATELPDLLEAAAAYMSFVEGRAQFSRPQLMMKVRQVETGEFNREDGLRSFGQLLRDGKIEKKGGGRFAASGRIGFRPDERAAG